MALVFISTIIFGALMPFAVNYFRTFDPPKESENRTEDVLPSEEGHGHNLEHNHEDDETSNMNYHLDFCHPNYTPEYIIFLTLK